MIKIAADVVVKFGIGVAANAQQLAFQNIDAAVLRVARSAGVPLLRQTGLGTLVNWLFG